MPVLGEKTCHDCMWFHDMEAAGKKGECRRHAPEREWAFGIGVWPVVDGENECVCGDYNPTPVPMNPTP